MRVEGCQKLFHFFRYKRQNRGGTGYDWEGWVQREGLGTQDFETNTELRHSAFSRAETAVVPFEVREGLEGEHTPETDITRCHQVLEEGDKFKS